jgi:hypothetical protein
MAKFAGGAPKEICGDDSGAMRIRVTVIPTTRST